MKKKYHTAFIIPAGANKSLGESGWEFNSRKRLPRELVAYLVQLLVLERSESYLEIEAYIGCDVKMSVFFNKKNEIESIYLQASSTKLSSLEEAYDQSPFFSKVELFIPYKI